MITDPNITIYGFSLGTEFSEVEKILISHKFNVASSFDFIEGTYKNIKIAISTDSIILNAFCN